MLNYISTQTFKYYSRLSQLPEDRLLKEVFEVDKGLFEGGYKSWYSSTQSLLQKFSTTEQEVLSNDMSEIISCTYRTNLNKELTRLRNQPHDNKLVTFSNIYTQFSVQNYLSFGLPKSKTKQLSKLRISAHDLLVERGRYFRPQIPREKRLCINCNMLENEEHFILFCSKYSSIRNNLLRKLNIDYHDLIPNSTGSLNIFTRLMNPVTVEETKQICEFIESAFKLR